MGYIRISPEFLPMNFNLYLIWLEKNLEKDTAFRKTISVQESFIIVIITAIGLSPRGMVILHVYKIWNLLLIKFKSGGLHEKQWRCVLINCTALSSLHSISQLPKRSTNSTALQIHTTLQDKSIRNEKKGRGADGGDVSRCTSRLAQAVTASSLWCDGQIPTAHRTSL